MLQGVSFEVAKGELLAILGRNGAGKTTTIKSVMGLAPPRQGRVLLDGEEVTGLKPYQVAQKGAAYVPASRGIFATLSALENLKVFEKKGGRYTTEGIFSMFPRLAEMKSRGGRTLSGGEQQMLAIGRTLVTDPSVILLDEPSQGLAPKIVDLVVDMMTRLKAEGMAIVLVEQNLELALRVADRVIILEQGAVVFEGPGATVRDDPELQARYLGVSV
ncbi:ABC transporter ATP-binding protein [Acuticoccus sediminis]|uniref:ABC transporter ATP-binding protein n=2 Tax=Acuticoccus sediminis TaxID=2184697 RepID=A0A8B2NVN9_9HYPH|nr:ABC transporter ATP-binding protein [Acuticoccus sediminis]